MVNHYCNYCNNIMDASFFDEISNEYQVCIRCFNENTEIIVQEKLQRDLEEQLKLDTIDVIDTFSIQPSKKDNNKIYDLMNKIYSEVLEIKCELNKFKMETNLKLDSILSKFGFNTNESKAFLLNYESNTINLNECLVLYNRLNNQEFKDVMLEAYNLTHKNEQNSWNNKVKTWSNKYPDIVQRKINGVKNRLKEASKDPKKAKQSRELYYSEKMIEFRLPTIRKMIEARGHLNISDFCIMESLQTNYKWQNDDIVNDLIANKNDNPDNDINNEIAYDEKEPSEFDLRGSYTNPAIMNQKDIMNRYR